MLIKRGKRVMTVSDGGISYNGVAGTAPPQPNRKGMAECDICGLLIPKEDWKARYKHAHDHNIELEATAKESLEMVERLKKQVLITIQ